MDKDNESAVSRFLSGTEEQAVSFDLPEDPFEKTLESQERTEEKEEKPLPYHKDAKMQKYIAKEIEKGLKAFRESEPERKEDARKEDDGDDYYARLIGNDTPEKVAMIREAKARDERMLSQAEERAFSRLSARDQEAARADREAEDELSSAFESIEDSYDVDLTSARSAKLRSEFVSFVERIAPKKNGEITDYPDMNYAWEAFSEMRKSSAVPSRAKELASRSMERSSGTVSKAPERMDWNAVDSFMDTLK